MGSNKQQTGFAAALLLLLGVSLGGCATSNPGSSLMDAHAEALTAPKTSAYLSVEDLPQEREGRAMTPDERSKLKKELIAARDRQAVAAKTQGRSARTDPVKP